MTESPNAPSNGRRVSNGVIRWPFRALQPLVEFRLVRREDGLGQGYLLGVGGSVEWRLTPRYAFAPTARWRLGNVLIREGQESAFTGFDLGLTLRFGSVRP